MKGNDCATMRTGRRTIKQTIPVFSCGQWTIQRAKDIDCAVH